MIFAFAGCSALGTTGTTGTTGGSGGTIQFVISIAVLFAVFYFFMIRPENKKKKKVEEMRSSLGNGDKITTIGGIMGEIVSVSGDSITIESGDDRVRIQLAKWAISRKDK
ncbi:MAG: preprotein translocase subunit YajC [Firmicutes bacterium HGW-Firmicutes-16]|nr:MAG: preprotein translocase subunit YajC [Firmicutes bacterium HGW-Firmicutes-16]